MILMPQIFDVTANENVRYKRNELECAISDHCINFDLFDKDLPNIDQNRTLAYCIQGKFHPRFIFALFTLWM